MTRLVKGAIVLCIIMAVTGCKLVIVSTSGGDVVSSSGQHDCAGGNLCEIEITSDDFTETFTAMPREGYVFEKWQGGPGFNCPDSTSPTCVVTNAGFIGLFGQGAAIHIASDTIDHVMPVYQFVGIDTDGDGTPNHIDEDDDNDGIPDVGDTCPLNPDLACGGPYVIADGKIWFQPSLFTGLTWNTINQSCPGGKCNGLLNGYNMDGWTWASGVDVQSLFDSYGTFSGDSEACPSADSFFYDGWIKTNSNTFIGNTIDIAGQISNNQSSMGYLYYCGTDTNTVGVSGLMWPVGAWFYQSP